MENMFGDSISDLMADLVGDLGFARRQRRRRLRHVRGCPRVRAGIAGQGVANPTSLLLSACVLLDHVGQGEAADRIRSAADQVVQAGEVRTRDMGGGAGTKEYTGALVHALS